MPPNSSRRSGRKAYKFQGKFLSCQRIFTPNFADSSFDLKEQASKQSEKYQEYDRAKQLARDIVNSRLKKIVAISAAPAQSDQVLKKFTSEEKLVYEQLVKIISEWKAKILENGEK